MHSCSDPSGPSEHNQDPIYTAYLENDSIVTKARKAYDKKTLQKTWETNTELLRNNTTDTLAIALYKQRMKIASRLYPRDSSIAIAHEYERWAMAKKDSSSLVDAWFRLAFYYKKSGEVNTSRNYDYKSIRLARDINDTLTFAKASINLANSLNDIQNYGGSQKIATEALVLDPPDAQKLKLYSALGNASAGQENYKDKLYWLDKSIELLQATYPDSMSTPKRIDLYVLKNNKAMGFFRMGENRKALEVLEDLVEDTLWLPEIANKNKRAITEYARMLLNLAKVKYQLEMDGPQELTRQSEALLTAIDNKKELAGLYAEMSEFYRYRDAVTARKIALRALDYARATSQTDTELKALRLLTELSPRPKAYAMAYQELTDSIQSEMTQARDAYARYQYDVDRTRARNLQLADQTRIQQLELRDSRIRSIFLAITVVILLMVGSLGYRLLRARARLKQAEEVRKTESAISKRIHDELANDLYNTMTFAELNALNTPEHKEYLLNTLDDIYKRTRNVSRENAGLPQGAEFGEAVSSLISQYRSRDTNILVRGLNTVKWELLEDYRQQTLYRVLQELLVNMRKHSGASLVVITFKQEGKKLQVSYKDNGKGLPGNRIPGGGGIENMESRLKQTGGHFKLESAEGKGVNVAMIYG
ncbi:sensor histidine kinase [Robertkochia sediminum]|uniref:sensor histidine kinase n=1 Tax=Robertkochia sediminum TaxID=2785326 RepID=UPI00193279B5|nr:ATP-binding protein [Robertkochia sediminum]MBL7471346.1 hypothetical protein [Robertkochia sediminum]